MNSALKQSGCVCWLAGLHRLSVPPTLVSAGQDATSCAAGSGHCLVGTWQGMQPGGSSKADQKTPTP